MAAGSLQVTAGQAWVTRDGQAHDWVLSAGDNLPLQAGEWVTLGPLDEGRSVALRLPGPQPGLRASVLAGLALLWMR